MGVIQGLDKFKFDGSGGSNIKSMQRGSISFSTSDLTKTVTISAIDVNKALVYIMVLPNTQPNYTNLSIQVINSTTITISRQASGVALNANWAVEEYNNVKSLQTGTITPTTDNQNVTISNINPLKAKLVVSYKVNASAYDAYYWFMLPTVVNATTINFVFQTGTGIVFTVYWQVIEFN